MLSDLANDWIYLFTSFKEVKGRLYSILNGHIICKDLIEDAFIVILKKTSNNQKISKELRR